MKEVCRAWIIRRRDGAVLPMFDGQRTRSRSRGFSFDEPMLGVVPRIFKTRQAAKNALVAWLQGKFKRVMESDGELFEGPSYCVGGSPVKVASRKAEDMEIVEVSIVRTR